MAACDEVLGCSSPPESSVSSSLPDTFATAPGWSWTRTGDSLGPCDILVEIRDFFRNLLLGQLILLNGKRKYGVTPPQLHHFIQLGTQFVAYFVFVCCFVWCYRTYVVRWRRGKDDQLAVFCGHPRIRDERWMAC
mmetsp:Transcript_1531/g.2251  ORF Transcript_1531/g.2251 Transcript_1531/m.2251 type:complete len:135 (+) Transcript_1531:537-941(+)